MDMINEKSKKVLSTLVLIFIMATISSCSNKTEKNKIEKITKEDLAILFSENADVFNNAFNEYKSKPENIRITLNAENEDTMIVDSKQHKAIPFDENEYKESSNCIKIMRQFMIMKGFVHQGNDYHVGIIKSELYGYNYDKTSEQENNLVKCVSFVFEDIETNIGYYLVHSDDRLSEEDYTSIGNNWYVYSWSFI